MATPVVAAASVARSSDEQTAAASTNQEAPAEAVAASPDTRSVGSAYDRTATKGQQAHTFVPQFCPTSMPAWMDLSGRISW